MLSAICREAEILTEERQDMVLESIGDCAGVRAGIDLKGVCDPIVIEDIVQRDGIEPQSVLIADVHRDGAVLLEIADVLIDAERRPWLAGRSTAEASLDLEPTLLLSHTGRPRSPATVQPGQL